VTRSGTNGLCVGHGNTVLPSSRVSYGHYKSVRRTWFKLAVRSPRAELANIYYQQAFDQESLSISFSIRWDPA
jgi:hypothetical protein